MTRRVLGPVLLLALSLSMAACATRSSGAAEAVMAPDGAITFTPKRQGLFGRVGETVVFRPGEPGYEAIKAQVEVLGTGARRPVLTWTIGEPELILPPGR
jgi:hypothetical protein